MHKKYVVIALVVLLAIAGGTLFAINRKDTSTSSFTPKESDRAKQLSLKFSDLQAHYPRDPKACNTTKDDPNLILDPADKSDIENAVAGTVIDIPAGTNVDVHIKTYEKQNFAAGTAIYESTFGSYNFIAQKAPKNLGADQKDWVWVVSTFEACRK